MVEVPNAIAVTTPVFEIVATPVLLEVQGLAEAGDPEPLNGVVVPTHNVVFPEIVGFGFTVIN
jgi:hypothetical protein